jgi:YggT family protein
MFKFGAEVWRKLDLGYCSKARNPCPFMHPCLTVSTTAHKERQNMQSLFQIIMLLLDIAWFIMIAHIIMSWLISFQVLNLGQQLVSQIWYGLNRLLEPVYAPIRRVLPNTQPLDLAPLVAFIGLIIVRTVLINNAAFFF